MTGDPAYNVLFCMIGLMLVEIVCVSIYMLVWAAELLKKKLKNKKKKDNNAKLDVL